MVEEYRVAVELAAQLPDDVQRHIAAIIAEELEEQEWDALVNRPESQRDLAALATEAREQEATGQLEDGGWTI